MELTRKQVIEILENAYARQYNGNTTSVAWSSKLCNAVYYAISSLKTDEAYQQGFKDAKADYEARLKADMMAMLEDLKKEMNSIKECEHQIYGKEDWNFVGKCQDAVQQKINKLKGEEDGNED